MGVYVDEATKERALTIAVGSGLMVKNGKFFKLSPKFFSTYSQVVKAHPINLDTSKLRESALRLADGGLPSSEIRRIYSEHEK